MNATKDRPKREPTPRLSESDLRCIQFANLCKEYDCNPGQLAGLCAVSRAAFNAGARETSIPDYDAGSARDRVVQMARFLGWSVQWPGLCPEFKTASGQTVRLPI